MYYYVLLLKYASEWHIDCFQRDTRFNRDSHQDRNWFVEAARAAVERLGIKKDSCRTIEDAQLFELALKVTEEGKTGHIELIQPPVEAVAHIELTPDD